MMLPNHYVIITLPKMSQNTTAVGNALRIVAESLRIVRHRYCRIMGMSIDG